MDTCVHSTYYHLATEFFKEAGPHESYYKHALMLLAYTPMDSMSAEQATSLATDMSLAAISGDSVYNFGEVLATPIVGALVGTPNEVSCLSPAPSLRPVPRDATYPSHPRHAHVHMNTHAPILICGLNCALSSGSASCCGASTRATSSSLTCSSTPTRPSTSPNRRSRSAHPPCTNVATSLCNPPSHLFPLDTARSRARTPILILVHLATASPQFHQREACPAQSHEFPLRDPVARPQHPLCGDRRPDATAAGPGGMAGDACHVPGADQREHGRG
mmetsp:Transcript_84195/g.239045  ORF Transcript_84195/g.239045 Transcript_84195/m.239045 type:complete len:275 (+) Transcript_84195:448-1272(+)